MHLDCTCAFSVYISKSEMWIVPIIKPIDCNIGPHHGQLDLDWQTLELEAQFLDLFNSSHNLHLISQINILNCFQGLLLVRTLENFIINAPAHNEGLSEHQTGF